jgi:hypothetical protein
LPSCRPSHSGSLSEKSFSSASSAIVVCSILIQVYAMGGYQSKYRHKLLQILALGLRLCAKE